MMNNYIKGIKAVLLFNVIISNAQKTITMASREELGAKNKTELIQIGLEILKEKQPSIVIDWADFEGTVWGNSKSIIVKFRRIIQYIPLGTDPEKHFSYDVTVNLNTFEILPFDDWFKSEFYIETKKDKKALAFIKKNLEIFSPSFKYTIYEDEEDYCIYKTNLYSFSKYKLNKKSGKETVEIQFCDAIPKAKVEEGVDAFLEIK